MATSYNLYKHEIKEYIKEKFPDNNILILDVGAGEGTYYNLLGDCYKNMFAVEIYPPNIKKYNLDKKYNNVICDDIQNFEYDWFDLIIFGDVIEHLKVEEANAVLQYAFDRCNEMIVAVPYEYKQGIEENNIYEIHIQDDLTPEIMKERYPYLELLYGNNEYGYYIKRKEEKDEKKGK